MLNQIAGCNLFEVASEGVWTVIKVERLFELREYEEL